uniref:macrophage mannose receptor 1-like isoform X2 n=1 Tax=Scatophagus argus TaxID=75038 RepID=UPI001ED85359|nr:macrophage mannose receptor 1-like isoform X2 [Scatophagus argus]
MKMTMMQQGLSGLLLLLLLLSSCASGLESVVRKDYRYFANQRTWKKAQSICRRYYTDLATIYTQSDTELMNMNEYFAWIGLHRPANFSTSSNWLWSDGWNNFINRWAQDEPGDGESCAFISSYNDRFYGASCEKYFFFICEKDRENNPRYSFSFIPQPKTWSEAQQYCRDQLDDLVTIKHSFNLDSDVRHNGFPVWTGLHKDGQTWKWSRGLSDYRKWASGEPGNNSDNNCVSISSFSKEMATQNCSARFPFVCFRDNLVLVKEKKTWEEALEHCRALQYELVSVQPGTDHSYVMRKVMEANTEKVWAGLRFLAGRWLWVNKASMLYSGLPHCPLERQHCGALSKSDSGSLETIDCLEKLNFLCYSTT